jgi:hypothetical protein
MWPDPPPPAPGAVGARSPLQDRNTHPNGSNELRNRHKNPRATLAPRETRSAQRSVSAGAGVVFHFSESRRETILIPQPSPQPSPITFVSGNSCPSCCSEGVSSMPVAPIRARVARFPHQMYMHMHVHNIHVHVPCACTCACTWTCTCGEGNSSDGYAHVHVLRYTLSTSECSKRKRSRCSGLSLLCGQQAGGRTGAIATRGGVFPALTSGTRRENAPKK